MLQNIIIALQQSLAAGFPVVLSVIEDRFGGSRVALVSPSGLDEAVLVPGAEGLDSLRSLAAANCVLVSSHRWNGGGWFEEYRVD